MDDVNHPIDYRVSEPISGPALAALLDEASADPSPAVGRGDGRVEQEEVGPTVPGDVDEADQPVVDVGRHPAQAVAQHVFPVLTAHLRPGRGAQVVDLL